MLASCDNYLSLKVWNAFSPAFLVFNSQAGLAAGEKSGNIAVRRKHKYEVRAT